MDRLTLSRRWGVWIEKYKYIFVVILVGFLLLMLPETEVSEKKQETQLDTVPLQPSLESSLVRILSMIEGAGKVDVLLTEARGEQILYQTDENCSSGEYTADTRTSTVLITENDRSETGLIRQRNPPVYQGAVIVCQGAGSANVRLSIVEAVKSVTGLTSDKITVVKMK